VPPSSCAVPVPPLTFSLLLVWSVIYSALALFSDLQAFTFSQQVAFFFVSPITFSRFLTLSADDTSKKDPLTPICLKVCFPAPLFPPDFFSFFPLRLFPRPFLIYTTPPIVSPPLHFSHFALSLVLFYLFMFCSPQCSAKDDITDIDFHQCYPCLFSPPVSQFFLDTLWLLGQCLISSGYRPPVAPIFISVFFASTFAAQLLSVSAGVSTHMRTLNFFFFPLFCFFAFFLLPLGEREIF